MKQLLVLLAITLFVSGAEAAQKNCSKDLVSSTFEHNVLKNILNDSGDKNVFIAAPALNTALAMITNGATAPAQTELLKALGVRDLPSLNQAVAKTTTAMNRQGQGLLISSGSAFWSDTSLPVNPDFTAEIQKVFAAPAGNLPFAADPAKATKEINGWASQMTGNMIPSIIQEDTAAGLAALLASAVYMKADWMYKFDKKQTRKNVFTLEDGQMVQADFMEQKIPEIEMYGGQNIPYFVARLPYASGDASMYIVFPNWDYTTNKAEVSAKDALLSAIANRDLERFQKNDGIFKMEEETLILPKFSLKYTNDKLKDVLVAMGVDKIFSGGSLLGISPDPRLYVSYVRMDSALEVDEEGSKAAAVASGGMALESMVSNQFEFNRPFGLIIRDDRNMVNLFSGVIQNPTAK